MKEMASELQKKLRSKRSLDGILKVLKEEGLQGTKDSWYDSKGNQHVSVHIPFSMGAIVIQNYKSNGSRLSDIRCRVFDKVSIKASGIPTFEPSGRRSF